MFRITLLNRCCPTIVSKRTYYWRSRIGNREVVGHGTNGIYAYQEDVHFPFPAIRYREPDVYVCCLRQKELGDWRCLSCEDKKGLYRASFCETFAEIKAPRGTWKLIVGYGLVCVSYAFWAMTFNHFFVFEERPASFSQENQAAQLRRMLEIRANPIDGISSKWDYINDTWK